MQKHQQTNLPPPNMYSFLFAACNHGGPVTEAYCRFTFALDTCDA